MIGDVAFVSPYSGRRLARSGGELVEEGGRRFPWREGAYRFVEGESYAGSFGLQWNRFERTQIDRFRSGYAQSRDRLFAATGWRPEELSGEKVLEVGSGAGRFTQVILDHTEAEIYSVDLSEAVEANFRNNGSNERLQLFQADLYHLPFAPEQFDRVVCFGVLQHTPDPRRSVECLARMVKPGGELVVDFYALRHWATRLHVKYLLRPLTSRMSPRRLLDAIDASAGALISIYRWGRAFGLGPLTKRLVPVCDIDGTLPADLSPTELREWVVLDTFDMFSPRYDQPQRIETVKGWVEELGRFDVWGGEVSYGKSNRVAVVRARREPEPPRH